MSLSETIITIAVMAVGLVLVGGAMAGYVDLRKTKILAHHEEELRRLVHRYEQLAQSSLDVQQRIAADLSDLKSRSASIEQILRTVE